jgi:hypothetical protein
LKRCQESAVQLESWINSCRPGRISSAFIRWQFIDHRYLTFVNCWYDSRKQLRDDVGNLSNWTFQCIFQDNFEMMDSLLKWCTPIVAVVVPVILQLWECLRLDHREPFDSRTKTNTNLVLCCILLITLLMTDHWRLWLKSWEICEEREKNRRNEMMKGWNKGL